MRPLLLFALAATALAPAEAQSRDWRPADRTIIGDYTRITAVAASTERIYATTPTALLIWNPQFRQWEGTFTPSDPRVLERVFVGLVDPLDNSLWLGRTDGWVHFDPVTEQWESGVIPGGVQEIAFDLNNPAAGLFVRSRGEWLNVLRGGSALPASAPVRPLRPASVADAIRANPTLRNNAAGILLDARMRNARYTAAAEGFAGRGWYLGTWGLGLLYLPNGAALPERLKFGLPGSAIGALYGAPGGVWVATDREGLTDPAVSYVASDLSEFRWIEGPPATGLPFNLVRALAGQQGRLWAGTDRGLAVIDVADGRVESYDESRGLPDGRVLDVAARRGRVIAGTAHGLAAAGSDYKFERLAPNFSGPAGALTTSGDTVWVGTDLGVFAALPGEPDLLQPEGLRESPTFQQPVIDLAWLGDTLVALTSDRLLWQDPVSHRWTLGPPLSSQLGRLRAFVPFADGVWIGGERGFGFARLSTVVVRPFLAPGDVPGPVTDLALEGLYLWVATPRGLVRFRLESIRS